MSGKNIPEVVMIRDYGKRHWPDKGQKGAAIAKGPLADFLGVNHHTIQRWLVGNCLPIGEVLVRLRYFLEIAGYSVPALVELKKSSPVYYKLGEIMAFARLSVNEITQYLEYTDPYGVLRLLHGISITSPERGQKIVKLYATHESKIREKRTEIMKLVGKKGQISEPQVQGEGTNSSQQSRPQHVEREVTQIEKDLVIEAVGHGLLGLLPLLERVVSEDFSPEDRKYLRKIVGYEVTSRMADAVRKLTSETARKQLSGNGGSDERK